MSNYYENLGRNLGRAAIPVLRKAKLSWQSLAGSEEDRIRADKQLGPALAQEVRNQLGLVEDPQDIALIQRICDQLRACVKNKLFSFQVELVGPPEPMALSLPGGFLFISRSMLDLCQRYEDEVAFVLGHEMAHVLRGHASDRLWQESALQLAAKVVGRGNPLQAWVGNTGLQMLASGHSQDCELEADEFGSQLAEAAGHHPLAGLRLLDRLASSQAPQSTLGSYLSSHPPHAQRMAHLRQVWSRYQRAKPAPTQ